jgi:diguanylate cyclase
MHPVLRQPVEKPDRSEASVHNTLVARSGQLEHLGMRVLILSALLAVAGCIAFAFQASRLLDHQDHHRRAAQASIVLLNILSEVQGIETGQQRFMLTADPAYLGPVQQGMLKLRKYLGMLDTLDVDGIAQPDGLASQLRAQLKLLNRFTLGYSLSHGLSMGSSMVPAIAAADELRTLIVQANARLQGRQSLEAQSKEDLLLRTRWIFYFWVCSVAAGFCAAFAYGFKARRLLRQESLRLAREASHDQLTGLPNRRYLQDWMDNAVAHSARSRQHLAALFIDLDGFSDINNTYGHDAGDAALVWASGMIASELRRSDFFARLGGDEFVIVCRGQNLDEVEALASRLLRRFAEDRPFLHVPAGTLGLSIGIAELPAGQPDPERLLHTADQAMYEAKRAGKRCYRVARGGGSQADAVECG